jgi:hypothetical protein
MTVTLVADAGSVDPWQTARVRIKRMFEAYRELTGAVIEYSVVIERNPKGTGYHAHFLLKGDYVKQATMRIAAIRAGCGTRKPDLRKIKWGAGQAIAGYGLKGFSVAGYGLKGHSGVTASDALAMNGGRLEHHSRGFISIEGKPVLLSVANKHAMRQRYGPPLDAPLMLFTARSFPFRVIDNGHAFYPEAWAWSQPNPHPYGFHPAFGRYISGGDSVPDGIGARAAPG